jgi:protein SCO1/2
MMYKLQLFVLLVMICFTFGCSADAPPVASADVYTGVELDGDAPNFELIDQHGETVALSDFRNKVTVLTFMDTECKEVCPPTAMELLQVAKGLSDNSDTVVFVGVNVNADANELVDLAGATKAWGLDGLANWHYLSGTRAELEPVWKDYNVEVHEGEDHEGVSHSPGVYIIDQAGKLRWYVSTPFVDPGTPLPSEPMNRLILMHIEALTGEAA